jgi:AraC-like DNA-binding protein
MLTRICAYIEANLTGNPTLETICKEFYISKNTVYRLFHREYNCTVGEFISQCRLKTAQKKLLEREGVSVWHQKKAHMVVVRMQISTDTEMELSSILFNLTSEVNKCLAINKRFLNQQK